MKTKLFVLLFFLSFSAGFVSAQKKDEISGFEKTTLTLNGNFQGINTRYDEKIISFQNTSGVTIYLALKNKNGVKDTTKTITYYNGELIYLYNPISDSIWIKGAYGTLEVYIYQGTGRGFIKSSPGSSNGNYSDSLKRFVQFSDSTTKYSTPASVNTALAGYYSKTASDARYLYKNDSLKYYSVNNLDTSLIAQQNQQNTFTENQKFLCLQ